MANRGKEERTWAQLSQVEERERRRKDRVDKRNMVMRKLKKGSVKNEEIEKESERKTENEAH